MNGMLGSFQKVSYQCSQMCFLEEYYASLLEQHSRGCKQMYHDA